MKRLTAVFVAAALCVGTAACGGSAQSAAKDVSSKAASSAGPASESSEMLSGGDTSITDSSAADSSAADISEADSSAADSSAADVSEADSSVTDSSAAESLAGEDSSVSSKEEKPVDDQSKAVSKVFDREYEIVPWEYEEYVPTNLSELEMGKVYEAKDCGDMTFLNDTEEDLIVYYESDQGVIGAMPFAAEVLAGLAIEDPIAYINEGDVVRVRVDKIDPWTLDRDTDGVIFVDELAKGKKIKHIGKYMLINGGNQDVSVKYTTMEGEPITITMIPGCVMGFEWLSLQEKMQIV